MLKHYLLALLLAIGFRPAFAAVCYVAPSGLDTNGGTIAAPFLTIQRAQTAVSAGDTVYVRGGTYLMRNTNISGHSTAAAGSYAYITLLSKSGSATAGRINYWAYPGEQPVFNYAGVDPNVTNTNTTANPTGVPAPYRLSAFEVTGSYIYLRGLEVVGVRVPLVATNVNTLSICFSQSGAGGNNIYERLSMHDGQAIGFYLTRGGNTLVLNCDAYRNNDNVNTANTTGTAGGGNVDGFGAHPNNATYTGNVFRGCRAWQNSDDGYDCISAFAATTFENCWAFYNGYTQNFVSRGDGNGFKAGGYGTSATPSVPATIPRNVVQGCVSVRNKANGFYANHHPGGVTFVDNTAYRNGGGASSANYNLLNRKPDYTADVPGYNHVVQNNLSYLPGSVGNDLINYDPATCTIDHNTYAPSSIGVTVSASDFIGLDTTLLRAPRQAGGSLPIIQTLRLAPGSGLIDAGTTANYPAGLTYTGRAPDVGAYEYANLWAGTMSTDWFASGNWTGGVPVATIDALIPTIGVSRYPVVSTGAAVARALTVSTGASLTQRGGTLSLTSGLTNNGTWTATGGTLATTGGSSQVLGGSSPLLVQSLSIGAAGATLGTPTSFQGVLTLLGNLTTNGQPLTLLSSVSGGVAREGLVVNSGGVVTGAVTVQRAIDPSLNAGLGYRHYASPVQNTTVADLTTPGFTPVVNPAYNTSATPGTLTPFPTVYDYDESRVLTSPATGFSDFDKGWHSPAALTDALVPGKGYTANIAATQLVDFVGTLTNGPVTQSVARNGGPNGGWQLLGNPYPAPLDWRQLTVPAGLDAALYVEQSTSQYGSSYRSYVNNVGNPVVALGQGFFVRATGPATVSFTNQVRLTTADATTFQRPAETRPLVQLTLQGSGSPLVDGVYVYFEQGATDGFEPAYDAVKLPNSTGLNLSSGTSGSSQQLAIAGHAPLGTSERVVPLSVGVPTVGSYFLSVAQLLNLSTVPAYLRDRQTGALIDLAQQPSYYFTVSNAAALSTGRFELVFSPQRVLAAAPAALAQQVALYPNPATTSAWVELPARLGYQTVTATLLDALGREVRTSTLPAQGPAAHQLDLRQLAAGVYALRLGTSAGVVVKKLVIN
ncbi:MAG: T9SS type A sorting domain-containing protein [Hymenobacter sp.]|nr:MAG: T9SS type A sorting domain-containing protein [Hymenobacter sp.]